MPDLAFYSAQLANLPANNVLVVRCIDPRHFRKLTNLVEDLEFQLKFSEYLRVIFLIYCTGQDLEGIQLPLPTYYLKSPSNIKSELIHLNYRLYSKCISDI